MVQPPEESEVLLTLKAFDIVENKWEKLQPSWFTKENKKFAEGGFRDAFLARSKGDSKKWVIKQYKKEKMTLIEDALHFSAVDHTRKQVQMHAAAKSNALRFAKKATSSLGESFHFHEIFFSRIDDLPVTVEEYVPGIFQKYVNNTGNCGKPPSEKYMDVYAKAETLCHFSYIDTNREMMLLDLQGSMYELYDPEIVTTILQEEEGGETNFFAGNLTMQAISTFMQELTFLSWVYLLYHLKDFKFLTWLGSLTFLLPFDLAFCFCCQDAKVVQFGLFKDSPLFLLILLHVLRCTRC